MDLNKIDGELMELSKKCKNEEELKKLAEERGIKLNKSELHQAFTFINQDEELNEDMLENVAGGAAKKEVVASDFTKITDEQALKAINKGQKVIYLDEGQYAVSNGKGVSDIKMFESGYYLCK